MLNLDNEYLVINGIDSRDYGIYLIDGNIFDFSIRDYQTYQIPGRTGDVSIDHGRWKNITVTFKCAAYDNARKKLDAWRAFLLSGMGAKRDAETGASSLSPGGVLWPGYHGSYKIETSIEPEIYRIGMIKSATAPQLSLQGGGGYVEVSFDCSPKKYLKSGLQRYLYSDTILNPTYYDARPLMRVQPSAANAYIKFENYMIDNSDTYHMPTLFAQSEISFNAAAVERNSDFYIDCEGRNASIEGINCNKYIELTGEDFPIIAANSALMKTRTYTKIRTSGMDIFELYPKWWTL